MSDEKDALSPLFRFEANDADKFSIMKSYSKDSLSSCMLNPLRYSGILASSP